MTAIAAVDFFPSDTASLWLAALAVVGLTLAGYRVWMTVSGWWADWRWRKHGIDRRSRPRGRRRED